MPTKEASFGQLSRSIPPASRSAQPLHNSSGPTSTTNRSAGNYHQPPSHQLNNPHHPPPSPSYPHLPSSTQVPSNLTNTYSNPSARHPSYGDHHQLPQPPPPPTNHYLRHQKPSPSVSTLPHPSAPPPLPSQHRLPQEEPRKIAGFKRKSSTSPALEHHPEHDSHLQQSTDQAKRRTSSVWPPPPSHSTSHHPLNHSQAYHHTNYYPNHQHNQQPPSSEACELVPSSLAGLLSTNPGPPHSATAPHQADVFDPTSSESSMIRRDPNQSRGRPTINKPSTSQTNSQIYQPSTPLSSASQHPLGVEPQWSGHHPPSVGSSPQVPRNTMLSTLDPAETPNRAVYSKPSTPLTTNQPLPERAPGAYGHSYRPENPHTAGSNDTHQPRSPAVYYHSYSAHRQHPHPQHHHPSVYPSPVPHDHRPDLHLRTNLSHPASRHSSLSTPDSHSLPIQSPSRSDLDLKHSYRLPHHQSPAYEHQFLHPSQNRTQHSDTSRLSPSISSSSLPYQASRPATSSSHNNQHTSMGLPSQQIRHSHQIDSPNASPDRPRLYQPEPRRIALSPPDLQLQLSPHHQNADLYPSQATNERLSQQATSTPVHPPRASHPQLHPSTRPSDDVHFSPNRPFDRLPEQLNSSTQGPPHHRSSRSTDLSNLSQPSHQPRPHPVYMHELSPRFQQAPGHPLLVESRFHRNENVHRERSHHPLSHDPEQVPRERFPSDRPAGDQARFPKPLPENITVQHATYLRREPLASPIAMQHLSYPSPSHRHQLSAHYEHQSTVQQRQSTQMDSPSNQMLNSPDGRPRVGSHAAHQVSRSLAHPNGFPSPQPYPSDPSQESYQQKKSDVASSTPRRQTKPGKMDRAKELSNTANSLPRPQATAHAAEMHLGYADASPAPSSIHPGGNHQKPSKSSPNASQLERPRSKGLPNVGPVTHPRPILQTPDPTDRKKTKFPPLRRLSSSSKYPLSAQDEQKDAAHDDSPGSSRAKDARRTTTNNEDCDTSMEPSSTGDLAIDEVADDGVIRCICSVTTDDGFTIQCETCEVWQHAVCVNVPIDEVPEHYFCDRCDPSLERRKQLIEMATRAEQIQRQRLKKEAATRSQDQPADENSITQGSPSISNQAGADEQDESFVDSPAASIAMSRVSSGACVNDPPPGELSGQSPSGNARGKSKATSSAHLDKLAATPYADNGLGLSGLQESPTSMPAPRVDDSSVSRDPIPRKPGRKPTKIAQTKLNSSKQPNDQAVSGSTTSNVLESEHNPSATNATDTDDRYEAWRYEYTPTLKDLYMDADIKSQVQQLIAQYLRLQTLCENDAPVGSDAEVPSQEVDSTARNCALPASVKPLSTSTGPCKSPVQVLNHLPPTTDMPTKSQRAVPHAFASTQFLPVTMSELPPPSKLTIKAIPPSNINFFPSLATSPFCPTFSNSLNNSSTSSLPRLITHGVFSTQPISRGTYIASLKGTITSMKKYTDDVYNQYASLGCTKPYVKFFKSTKLQNRLLRDPDSSAQIEDGLVIDSRQYGNEMRFIRNGCHPNAFINIIMTPQAPRSHDPEAANVPDLSRSGTPSSRMCSFPTTGLDRHHHSDKLWSTADCDQPLPWEVSFGIFAASDISRREEIILPWEWDDQHLVHLLPRLLSHSSTFEAQQQRSPTLPPVRIQFLPWSLSDLKLLSCKLAAVTLTLFGLMFCGCERKKSCAINLMWKVGCLSAGEPMFPTNQDGFLDCEACEMTSISSLKERQESNLPLTFQERFRLVLHSFLEQPNPVLSKIGRNANSNASAPSTTRQKKPKIDLGPLLGLRRDWWLHSASEPMQTDAMRTAKTTGKKQKRPRSRSVFNRKPSVHKIRRVSDVGELRQPGVTVANSIAQKELLLPEVEPSQAPSAYQPASVQTELPMIDSNNQFSTQSHLDHHRTPLPQSSAIHAAPQTNLVNAARVDQSSIVLSVPDTLPDLSAPSNFTHLQNHDDTMSDNCATEDIQCLEVESQKVPEHTEVSQSELLTVDSQGVSDPSTRVSEVHKARKDDSDQAGFGTNQLDHVMELVSASQVTDLREKTILKENVDLLEPKTEVDRSSSLPADAPLAEMKLPSSSPEEGEVQEEEAVEEHPTHVSPPGPTPGYQFPASLPRASLKETFYENELGSASGFMEPLENALDAASVFMEPLEVKHKGQDIDYLRKAAVAAIEPPPQDFRSSSPELASVERVDQSMLVHKMITNEDLPAMEAQLHDADVTTSAQLIQSQAETDDQCNLPIQSQTPPSDLRISPLVQDSREIVESLANLTPDPPVTSPRGSGEPKPSDPADSPHKSPDPVPHDDTSQIVRIGYSDDCEEATTIENQVAAEAVANIPGQLISVQEPETLHLTSQEAIRPLPESLVSPFLNQAVEPTQVDSPTRLSQRSASIGSESRLESQDDSALSQPSEGSEEHLLDSDASTTILGSSDEEMLSSHTPRYLNNRKRIRSKNILKPPPRIGPVKKPISARTERLSGFAASGMTRLNKPELRALDNLKPLPVGYRKGNSNKTSSLSDLESEDDTRDNSTDPVVKESGSKMRLTIRSSSPSENEDDDFIPRVAGKQRPSSKVSPIPSLLSVADPAPDSLGNVDASVIVQKLRRVETVPAPVASVSPSSDSHLKQSPSHVTATKSDPQTPDHLEDGVSHDASTLVVFNSSVAVPERVEDTSSTTDLTMAIIKKPPSEGLQPAAQRSSVVVETQLSDPPPQPCSTSASVPEVNPPADPHQDTSLPSPAQLPLVESKKAAPKRISLKDYRSRKVTEAVVIAPLANPLIHFTTKRPTSTSLTHEPQRKQPPPPIIPALPPLLPPSSQSQPLLPLSPRKLELVASVLKKEEKDRSQSSKDGESNSESRKDDGQIPNPVPELPSFPRGPLAEDDDRNMDDDEVDLKKSSNQIALEQPGKPFSVNIPQLNLELQLVKISPQECEDHVVGAYEDDIDGVAIESMSTPSEGEIDEEEHQQEMPDNEVPPQHEILDQEQVEMHCEESHEVPTQEHHNICDQTKQEISEEVAQGVPSEEPHQPDKKREKQTPDGEKQPVKQLHAQQSQEEGPNVLRTTSVSEQKKSPSNGEADQRPVRDAEMTLPPCSNKPADLMELDEAHSCPKTDAVVPDEPFPPCLAKAATHDEVDRSDYLPPIKTEHAEGSTSHEMAIQSMQPEDNGEEDMDISPTIVQHPPPPKPRLSIADYRRRKVTRPSTSEEPHQSQSISPSVPDLELSRVNPQSSITSPQSFQKARIPNVQRNQQDTEMRETKSFHAGTDEDRCSPPSSAKPNPSPLPPLPSELKPDVNKVQPADGTVNVAFESRSTDTTMYFPPISPSILMAMESPRSPQLAPSPSPPGSPSVGTTSGRRTRVAATPKSPSRTPLESTPVTSISSLKSDLKPMITASQLSGATTSDDRPIVQTALPAFEPPNTQSPSLQLSALKSTSPASSGQANIPQHNQHDPPKSFPSVHATSLPVPIASSHPLVHQNRKPTPTASGGLQPTPIDVNPLIPRVQNPAEAAVPVLRGDQPAPLLGSSRPLMSGLSSQRSPKIPLSPLVYKPGILPSSSAPTSLAEPRSNPRGPPNIPLGGNRDPPSRTLRVPPNSNSSRASWPPESAGLGHNDQHLPGQALAGAAVHTPVTTKNFSDIPSNPNLPPHPTHHAGPPRSSPYHYPPHRGGGGFPPMRNFSAHRATTTPIMGTSGPGPPGPFRQSQQSSNEGSERARYDGMVRAPIPSHASTYAPRGRAKVRGVGPPSSYWRLDNNNPGAGAAGSSGSSGSGAGRGFAGPPRNDR